MTPQDKRRLAKRRRYQRKKRKLILLCISGSCILLVGYLAFITVRAYTKPIRIDLTVDNAQITQGEALPEFHAEAAYHGDHPDKVLDKDNNVTIQDLVDQLNSGDSYSLTCDADPNVDNAYPIKLKLSDEVEKKLEEKWASRIELNIKNATLTVKNSMGTWEDTKFKLTDGNYLTGDFLASRGNTYYFDENGEMVTGERRIGLKDCKFSKDGILQSKGDAEVKADQPMIALTFDDGPGEYTDSLLNVLERYNAHATFFMQGKNVSSYPEAVQKMLTNGCELGNHSYNHPQLTNLSSEQIQQQVGDTNSDLTNVCGQSATLLRPPYGAINDTVSASVGMPMILWSVDTLDWKTKDVAATLDSILNTSEDGDIVLLHDIHDFSVTAAISAIPELTRRGYQLVTVSEMAAAKGVALANGETYTDMK